MPPSLATPLPNKYQTRFWLLAERRQLHGHFQRLMNELRIEDPQAFFNFFRMEPAMFDELVQIVGPRITKIGYTYEKASFSRLENCYNSEVSSFRRKISQSHIQFSSGKKYHLSSNTESLRSYCGRIHFLRYRTKIWHFFI